MKIYELLLIFFKRQDARKKIIDIMNKTISKPRQVKKPNHPVLKLQDIDVTQRGRVLGVGGLNLKQIYSKTGVTINLVDEKTLSIFAPNEGALADAEEMLKALTDQKVKILGRNEKKLNKLFL